MEVRRNVGESSCNFGDGTDQRVQSLMFMMMTMTVTNQNFIHEENRRTLKSGNVCYYRVQNIFVPIYIPKISILTFTEICCLLFCMGVELGLSQ